MLMRDREGNEGDCDLTPIEVLAMELRDDGERVFHYRTDDDGHIIQLLNFRRHHWTSSSLIYIPNEPYSY